MRHGSLGSLFLQFIRFTGRRCVKSCKEEEKSIRDERVFDFLVAEYFGASLGLDFGIFLELVLSNLVRLCCRILSKEKKSFLLSLCLSSFVLKIH